MCLGIYITILLVVFIGELIVGIVGYIKVSSRPITIENIVCAVYANLTYFFPHVIFKDEFLAKSTFEKCNFHSTS